MIQNYIIEIGGVELDTFGDLPISLNYQIEDILDITKRKTNYSKTIELPATPKNNLIFKQIFDVNIETLFYNPAVSSKEVVVRVGGDSVFTGNLQIINIKDVNGERVYEVIIASMVKTILGEISDYKLDQLDMSEYNHYRTKETVHSSWYYDIYYNGVLKNNNSGGEGYVYPHIINNFDSTVSANEILLENQLPATYVSTIINKIFNFAGYTYTSEFFDSEYFKKLIIPFTGDKIELDEVELNKRTVVVGVDGSGPESNSSSYASGYQSFTSDYLSHDNGWFKSSDWSYYTPLSRESGELADIKYQDMGGQWSNYGGWTCVDNGYYDFKMDLKLIAKYISIGPDFRFNGTNTWKYYYRVNKVTAGNVTTNLYTSTYPFETAPSDDNFHQHPWYDLGNPLTMGAILNNIYMETGDRFVIEIGINYNLAPNQWQVQGTSDNVRMKLLIKESLDGQPSYVKIAPSSSQSYGNEYVTLAKTLPNWTMRNFLLEIIKTFKLIMIDNPNKANDLIIEPRDKYFESKKKVRVMDDILDNSSEVIISPMSEVDARTYILTYSEDNDFYNEEYTNETGEVYGSIRLDIQNDFSFEENKLELKFAPTPNASQFIEPRVAPFFAKMSGIAEFKASKVKPRILFYGGPTLVNYFSEPSKTYNENRIFLKDYKAQPLVDAIEDITYPYCGMWDEPYAPQYSLEFGPSRKVYWDTSMAPFNNLYQMFHRSTIENIIDINSKLFEGWFHLTSKWMSEFDFRDVIFLRGQYWRIVKIKDYNPSVANTLTNVVLYKITDYNAYTDSAKEITVVTKPCPNDLMMVRKGSTWNYVSASGGIVSKECCNSVGGEYVGDVCKIREMDAQPQPAPIVGPGKPLRPTVVGTLKPVVFTVGGNAVPTPQPSGPSVLTSTKNTIKGSASTVKGTGNYLGPFTDNIIINGNNNAVAAGVKNVFVVGDGVSVTESNSIYLGGIRIDSEGTIHKTGLTIIDAGENVVFPFTKTNPVEIIDGTVDSVRNPNGDYNSRVIIDANDKSGEPD